jgi:choline dehydrogenase-like flavoprotein
MDLRSRQHDFDWLVIGSGFGGSVAALRLSEKGYRVGVLECGRRYEDADFARTAWNLRRYFWAPRIGLRGVFRLTLFKDVFIASGSGVGGGSLGYANTLYRARPAFFRDPQWGDLADWEDEMRPHYDTAERMLGVVDYEGMTRQTTCCASTAPSSASPTRSSQPGSACSSARRAARSRTPTSTATGPHGPDASAAGAAWWAAATAPRTRW